MKKLIVRFGCVALIVAAQVGAGNAQTITLRENGKVIPIEMKWVCPKHPDGCTCSTRVKKSCVTHSVIVHAAPAVITQVWTQPVQPTVVTQYVVQVQQVQRVVVEQPVYVQQPVITVPQLPAYGYGDVVQEAYWGGYGLSASASIGFNTYPVDTGKFWYDNSYCGEMERIARTRYNYGIQGNHSYRGRGNSYYPPVQYMQGMNGLRLPGHGRGRR